LAYESSVFTLTLTFKGVSPWKSRTIQLARTDVETRGKSPWLRDNTWRLTQDAIVKFSEQIDKAIRSYEAKK
jgi:hypothetical protein